MSTGSGRDPFVGSGAGRHAFLDSSTFTGAPADLQPVYLPGPDSMPSLLPPAGAPVPSPAPAAPTVPATEHHLSPHVPHHQRPHLRRGVAARGKTRHRGDIALTIAGIGLGITLGMAVYAVKDGLDLPGGKMLAVGTISALVGTYLCLMLMLLVSRLPWLER